MEPLYLSLYQYAISADSLQSLVDQAHAMTGLSIVLADSIHNIVAASENIGTETDWNALIAKGLLPEPPPMEERYRMPLPIQIRQSPPVHISRCALPGGGFTFMGDLRDGEHIILKTAVMKADETAEAFAAALAESAYLLYFRLTSTGCVSLSGRGRYLLSLIQGHTPDTHVSDQWLGVEQPYCLLMFPKPKDGVVALSFSQNISVLEKRLGFCVRTVSPEEALVLLVHVNSDRAAFLRQLNALFRPGGQAVGVSDAFDDLGAVQMAYRHVVHSLYAASDFSGFCRCATHEEFAVFEMFRFVETGDPEDMLLHEDAKLLQKMGGDQAAHALETLFAWLYYEKNAAEASRHLFVHRNTLDNRMRKITNMLESDWGNRGYCTQMMYSVWLLLKRSGNLRDTLLYLP